MPRVGFEPIVRVSEEGLCLRPRSHCDRQFVSCLTENTHDISINTSKII
jgi:hypothetical protein